MEFHRIMVSLVRSLLRSLLCKPIVIMVGPNFQMTTVHMQPETIQFDVAAAKDYVVKLLLNFVERREIDTKKLSVTLQNHLEKIKLIVTVLILHEYPPALRYTLNKTHENY
mmetsp:Transcript_24710/g.58006  ORF Transcript_24710/g.58006 Transcript_24710/m.58006 type:complete len:111 (+) Transcript_24710:2020-2352(+)